MCTNQNDKHAKHIVFCYFSFNAIKTLYTRAQELWDEAVKTLTKIMFKSVRIMTFSAKIMNNREHLHITRMGFF